MHNSFPTHAGIYIFKNAAGDVLYIGKAKNLRKRLATYFQKREQDWKIAALLAEHTNIEFVTTDSEQAALVLEATLISTHKPKYNVLLRDGQPFVYICLTKKPYPMLDVVRTKNKKATHFGPFMQKSAARKVLRYLETTFRLRRCNKRITHGCLDYHIGTCAGSCLESFNAQEYEFRLELALDVLRKDHVRFMKKVREKIQEHSASLDFEKAQTLSGYLDSMHTIFAAMADNLETKDVDRAHAVVTAKKMPRIFSSTLATDLQHFFGTEKPIHSIDCFDISHFQGRNIVGSCVRFTDGKLDAEHMRKFNIRTLTEQNDYAALAEIVERRYKNGRDFPDLVLIDGGKGQLSAVQHLVGDTPIAALAKQEEKLFTRTFPNGRHLDLASDIGQLLISLRDYAHHVAVSHHRHRRSTNS